VTSPSRPPATRPSDGGATRGLAVTGAVLAAALVVLLAALVTRAWPPLVDTDLRIDSAIHEWALAAPWAVATSRVLASLGSVYVASVVAAVAVVVLLLARRRRTALAVALVAVVALLLTHYLTLVVDRERPTWPDPFVTLSDPAFPSGHATAGIAVWCVCGIALGTLVRDRSWEVVLALPFVVLGVAIGISRLVLGVHWPSDVVGGWCVALAVAGVVSAAVLIPPRRAGTSPGRVRPGG
jgi:membrane-associated phospholipid phosphatase